MFPTAVQHRETLEGDLTTLSCLKGLQSLCIGFRLDYSHLALYPPTEPTRGHPIQVMPSATQLSDLLWPKLTSVKIDGSIPNPHKPGSYRVKIELLRETLAWLRTAGHLEYLSMKRVEDRMIGSKFAHWPQLQHLQLHCNSNTFEYSSDVDHFIQSCRNLASLEIHYPDSQTKMNQLFNTTFSSKSMESLTVLKLINIDPPSEIHLPFATMFPVLEVFSLLSSPISSWPARQPTDNMEGVMANLFPPDLPCPSLKRFCWRDIPSTYTRLRSHHDSNTPFRCLLGQFTDLQLFPALEYCFVSFDLDSAVELPAVVDLGLAEWRNNPWRAVHRRITHDLEVLVQDGSSEKLEIELSYCWTESQEDGRRVRFSRTLRAIDKKATVLSER